MTQNVLHENVKAQNGDSAMAKFIKLKQAIVGTGMNQEQFAQSLGISATHLSAILNGKRPKYLDHAQAIAHAVGMTVDELWPWPEKEEDV